MVLASWRRVRLAADTATSMLASSRSYFAYYRNHIGSWRWKSETNTTASSDTLITSAFEETLSLVRS